MHRSATDRAAHRSHGSTSPRQDGRFPRTYAAWWARLAAPGSRFTSTPPAPPVITRLDVTSIQAPVIPERRTA